MRTDQGSQTEIPICSRKRLSLCRSPGLQQTRPSVLSPAYSPPSSQSVVCERTIALACSCCLSLFDVQKADWYDIHSLFRKLKRGLESQPRGRGLVGRVPGL